MTQLGGRDSPMPDAQQQEHPPRLLEPGAAAVSGDLKQQQLEVKQESNLAPSSSIHQSSPGSNQPLSVSSQSLRLDRPHDHSPFNSSIQPTSASLPDNSRSFNSTSTTSSTETLDTFRPSRPKFIALQQQAQIIIQTQPPTPGVDDLTTMSTTLQTLSVGQKRSREVDDDETQQLQSYNTERRIARMRDNSNNATFAATNISENSISSTSFFLPSHERSSPPRARSNALSASQTQPDIIMTPYPSDGEEVYHNNTGGFAKIPALSLRRKETTVNPFSAAQSPADSLNSSMQNEDYQDTSMVTDVAEGDEAMDMDMDDAPTFSPQTSFSFKPPTTTASNSNPFLSPSSSTTQATFLLQSGRLPSPATSDDDRSSNPTSNANLANELENFGQMGMLLEGAQQDNQGKWRVPSGSRNMGHVANGMNGVQGGQGKNFGRGGAKPRVTMGFRADCEKCVRRAPGHYMHIL